MVKKEGGVDRREEREVEERERETRENRDRYGR